MLGKLKQINQFAFKKGFFGLLKNKSNKQELKKKYEVYKPYLNHELLSKDPEFRVVRHYDDYLDKNVEAVKTSIITRIPTESKVLQDEAFKRLFATIQKQKDKLTTNLKEEYEYNLREGDEQWYPSAKFNTKDVFSDESKQTSARNRVNEYEGWNFRERFLLRRISTEEHKPPFYPSLAAVKEGEADLKTRYFDVINRKNPSKSTELLEEEEKYSDKVLFRYHGVKEEIFEDMQELELCSNSCLTEVSSGKFVYSEGEFSLFMVEDNISIDQKADLPRDKAKLVFSLDDITKLNQAVTEVKFIELGKRIMDVLENFPEEQVTTEYWLSPCNQFLVVMLDLKSENGFDVVIKDLKNDILLPVVLYSCTGDIAFDSNKGIFYTQVDDQSRGAKVFRHQIGVPQNLDILVYHEENTHFELSVWNDKNNELLFLQSRLRESPYNNVIWARTALKAQADFFCVKELSKECSYTVNYANGVFLLRIRDLVSGGDTLCRLANTFGGLSETEVSELKKIGKDLVSSGNLEEIKQIEGKIEEISEFKHHTALIESSAVGRELKIISKMTGKEYLVEQFKPGTAVQFKDNRLVEAETVRYLSSSLVEPSQVVEVSLNTRIQHELLQEAYLKFLPENYHSEVIMAGETPILVCHRRDFNLTEESNVLVYTMGIEHSLWDMTFTPSLVPMLNRGFILAVPLIRGSRLVDDDWREEGLRENKFNGINDFTDCLTKLNDISRNISLVSDTPSGGFHCILSLFIPELEIKTVACFNPLINVSRDGEESEFGDLKQNLFKDLAKLFDPTKIVLPRTKFNLLMLFDDNQSKFTVEGHNMLSRMRRARLPGEMLIKQDASDSEDERLALMFSWIVGKQYLS